MSEEHEHEHHEHRYERPAYAIPVKAAWTVGVAAMTLVASGAAWMTSMSASNATLQQNMAEIGNAFDEFILEMRTETRANREAIAEVRGSAQTKAEAMADRDIIMSQIRELDRSLTRIGVVLEQQTSILERLSRSGRMPAGDQP